MLNTSSETPAPAGPERTGLTMLSIQATPAMVKAISTTATAVEVNQTEALRRLIAYGFAIFAAHREGHEILLKITNKRLERIIITEDDDPVVARIVPDAGEIVRALGVERGNTD